MKNCSRFSEASIAYVNKEIRALAYDLQVLISVYDYKEMIEEYAHFDILRSGQHLSGIIR